MSAVLEEILQRHPVWRGGAPASVPPVVATGFTELDRELPGGGWPTGMLSEILVPREGIGELSLLMPALAALSWAGKRVLVLAPPHLPYAPALAAGGIDLANLVVVRAPGRRDALWAAEQVLRAASCHALVAWFDKARYEELRRLAVAAETSKACVLLFRTPQAAHESSPAGLRLLVDAAGDALEIQILKRRGAPAVAALILPVKRPVHALGRTSFSNLRAGHAGSARRVDLPVHA